MINNKSEHYIISRDYIKLSRYFHEPQFSLLENEFHFCYDLESSFLNKFLGLFTEKDFLTNINLRINPLFIKFFKTICSLRHGCVDQLVFKHIEVPILTLTFDTTSSKYYECHKEYHPNIIESNKEFILQNLCLDIPKAQEFIKKIKMIGWYNICDFYTSIKRYWETIIYYPDNSIRPEWQARANLSDPQNIEYKKEAIRRAQIANEQCSKLAEVLYCININKLKEMIELYGDDKESFMVSLVNLHEIGYITIKI